MSKDLNDLWEQADLTGLPIPVGDNVVCDICNEDFTTRTDPGGFVFGSYAYCPFCAREKLPAIRSYEEEHRIKEWAKPGEAFADFVRRYRGPDSSIKVTRLP